MAKNKIYRKDGKVFVEVLNSPGSLSQPGVKCLNPEEKNVKRRIYQKVFSKKPIFLPDEYKTAIEKYVAHVDNFVFSANGYSSINDEQCLRYGIQPGAYEEACSAIIRETILHLRKRFKGANLKLIYGASDMGIDMAIEKVAKEFNITPLGFSCPEFMLYVKDDEIPVYVGKDKDGYADFYIKTLDMLLCTGGRKHALQHDILAACVYNKRIHFVDVLNSLSCSGGVPATIVKDDGSYMVDNAAAAFGQNISFFSRDDAKVSAPKDGDHWDAIFANVNSIATDVCRRKMSPYRKFQ